MPIISCGYCGKEQHIRPCYVKDKNFCNKSCYSKYLRQENYTKTKCIICGKEFEAPNYYLKRGQYKTCSVECGNKIRLKGDKNPAWKGGKIDKTCDMCGKLFKVKRERTRRGGNFGHYCSKKCYGQWVSQARSGENSEHYIERIEKECLICKNIFKVLPSIDQKTCSRKCSSQYASSFNKYFNNNLEQTLVSGLNENLIPFETQKSIFGRPDIFIAPNICIFADGDYWHAWSGKYKADDMFIGKRTAQNIWDHDEEVNKLLIKDGYVVLRFWEHDIYNNFPKVIADIQNTIYRTN
jgi:G:T-mismatch repair DNA endonuclease (very short patch repair protein)